MSGNARFSGSLSLDDFQCETTFSLYDWVKPALDSAIASALFLMTLPIVAAAWVLVRMTSKGPGVYTQVRVGRGGRLFRIYKLRTMYHNCEATSGVRWSIQGDPRITPVGRWLRRTHIDELPQLWNVLRGHMSMVGPRPERPEFVHGFVRSIPDYAGRLVVRPGLTGLAQIQLPPDTDLESVKAKLALDLCYIERLSAWLDVRLMAGTLLYLLGASFGAVRRLLLLPGQLEDLPMPAMQPILAS